MVMNTICSVLCLLCACMSICMSIKLMRRSRELRKATERTEKLERLYGRMAQELHNMTDSMVLFDADGVAIFYQKILDLHIEFMAIGVDDHECTNSHHSTGVSTSQ